MEPRLVIKTHSDVSYPGIFSIILSVCSYPDKASYPEIVSKRLYKYYSDNGINFNKLGAKFSVIMARRFEFLRENMIWDWRGNVINAVLKHIGKIPPKGIEPFLDLSDMEKITYLKYYLEYDGSMILMIFKILSEHKILRRSSLEKQIHLIFREIYVEYIELTSNYKKRIELKERLKRIPKEKCYDSKTVHHKIKPHIYAMINLGLLDEVEATEGDEIYSPKYYYKKSTSELFLNEIPDLKSLEERFERYDYFLIITKILAMKSEKFNFEKHSEILRNSIYAGYQLLKDNITGMASINSITDWCSAHLLSTFGILLETNNILELLKKVRLEKTKGVRFHADYRGTQSYVILAPEFIK